MADFITSGPIGFSGSYPGSASSFVSEAGGSITSAGGISLSDLFASANSAGITLSGSASYSAPDGMSEFYGMSYASEPGNTGAGGVDSNTYLAVNSYSPSRWYQRGFGYKVDINAAGDKIVVGGNRTIGDGRSPKDYSSSYESKMATWLFYNDPVGSDTWLDYGYAGTDILYPNTIHGTRAPAGAVCLSAPAGHPDDVIGTIVVAAFSNLKLSGPTACRGNERHMFATSVWSGRAIYPGYADWFAPFYTNGINTANYGASDVALSEDGRIMVQACDSVHYPNYNDDVGSRVYAFMLTGDPTRNWFAGGVVGTNWGAIPTNTNYNSASTTTAITPWNSNEETEFGRSVALNACTGNYQPIVAVGAPSLPSASMAHNGFVQVFRYPDTGTAASPEFSGSWVQMGSTINGTSSMDFAGVSVALNDEGNMFVVGCPNTPPEDDPTSLGSARVYGYDMAVPNDWAQIGSDIVGHDGIDNSGEFGMQVAMNGSGNVILVTCEDCTGYYNHSLTGGITEGGAVYAYLLSGGQYEQFGPPILCSNDQTGVQGYWSMRGAKFGYDVALNKAGDKAVVGAPFWDEENSTPGDNYGLVEMFNIQGLP